MNELKMTRWGRVNYALILAFLTIPIVGAAALSIWLAYRAVVGSSHPLVLLLLLPIGLFLLVVATKFYKTYTCLTLTLEEDGIAFRTLLGERQHVSWFEVYSLELGDGAFIGTGPVSRHFSELSLTVDAYQTDGSYYWFCIPLHAYPRPADVFAFITSRVFSEEVNAQLPEPLPPEELASRQEWAAETTSEFSQSQDITWYLESEVADLTADEIQKKYRTAVLKSILFGLPAMGFVLAALLSPWIAPLIVPYMPVVEGPVDVDFLVMIAFGLPGVVLTRAFLSHADRAWALRTVLRRRAVDQPLNTEETT